MFGSGGVEKGQALSIVPPPPAAQSEENRAANLLAARVNQIATAAGIAQPPSEGGASAQYQLYFLPFPSEPQPPLPHPSFQASLNQGPSGRIPIPVPSASGPPMPFGRPPFPRFPGAQFPPGQLPFQQQLLGQQPPGPLPFPPQLLGQLPPGPLPFPQQLLGQQPPGPLPFPQQLLGQQPPGPLPFPPQLLGQLNPALPPSLYGLASNPGNLTHDEDTTSASDEDRSSSSDESEATSEADASEASSSSFQRYASSSKSALFPRQQAGLFPQSAPGTSKATLSYQTGGFRPGATVCITGGQGTVEGPGPGRATRARQKETVEGPGPGRARRTRQKEPVEGPSRGRGRRARARSRIIDHSGEPEELSSDAIVRTCINCNPPETFENAKTFRVHCSSEHRDEKIKCWFPDCQTTSTKPDQLVAHFRNAHVYPDRYTCGGKDGIPCAYRHTSPSIAHIRTHYLNRHLGIPTMLQEKHADSVIDHTEDYPGRPGRYIYTCTLLENPNATSDPDLLTLSHSPRNTIPAGVRKSRGKREFRCGCILPTGLQCQTIAPIYSKIQRHYLSIHLDITQPEQRLLTQEQVEGIEVVINNKSAWRFAVRDRTH